MTIPSSVPQPPIRQLSPSDCETSRDGLAPNATRTANSDRRSAARINNNAATFTPAIRNTRAAAASRNMSSVRVLPTTVSSRGTATIGIGV